MEPNLFYTLASLLPCSDKNVIKTLPRRNLNNEKQTKEHWNQRTKECNTFKVWNQIPYLHGLFGKKEVILWGAKICDKYKASLSKVDKIHGWIVKINEINVYKNHNIFELRALREEMNETETTNYSYDAEFFVNTVHGCRIMIKIFL